MYNIVSTLMPSFLIGSSSFLQVKRTTIISRTSLNFGQIRPRTVELAALECLKKSFTYLRTIQNIFMTCWLSGERSLPFGLLVFFSSSSCTCYFSEDYILNTFSSYFSCTVPFFFFLSLYLFFYFFLMFSCSFLFFLFCSSHGSCMIAACHVFLFLLFFSQYCTSLYNSCSFIFVFVHFFLVLFFIYFSFCTDTMFLLFFFMSFSCSS